MEIFIGLTIPLLGTVLGAATVFMMRKSISSLANNAMLGFVSGIMVAASFWSLLQPALEQAGEGWSETWPVIAGFVAGMLFLLGLDTFIPHQHADSANPEGPRSSLSRSTKMILAVALHNIPEGMAVGLAFASAAGTGDTLLMPAALASAAAMALGIGIQNIPEGAAIALPLRQGGMSRRRSFAYGAASGVVEPFFGVLAALCAAVVSGVMPWLMAFSAGAMIWVVFSEMLPESGQQRDGAISAVVGYVLMMALDLALG